MLIYDYFITHWKSLSLVIALLFFSMDMSGIIGGIGYTVYYPLVIGLGAYVFFGEGDYNKKYIFFLLACLLSIILNPDIPAVFHSPIRLVVYAFILLAFSGLKQSRKLALIRLHALHMMSLLTIVIVVVNFAFLKLGFVSATQMDLYKGVGIYTGSTANNEMGALGALAIMSIVVYFCVYKDLLQRIEYPVLVLALVCGISMMALASSRMGLLCTLISLMVVVYKYNSEDFSRVILWMTILCVLFVICVFIFQDDFTYMLSKQGGDAMTVNTSTRDNLWDMRIKEFKSSPIFGVGFASVRNLSRAEGVDLTSGRIESGSGWLTIFSQLGILGAICMFAIVYPNIKYILTKPENDYFTVWAAGFGMVFLLQPLTEGYLTNIGAALCCLFWLYHSVVDALREGYLTEEDLDLSLENVEDIEYEDSID